MYIDLLQEEKDRVRRDKDFGVQFHIDAEAAYESGLADDRVVFGESKVVWANGNQINYQDIYIDGKNVGILREYAPYNIFKPMTISFLLPLEDEEVTDELRQSPHFVQEEWCDLWFATLKQLVNHLGVH